MEVEETVNELKKLRAKWRREATRSRRYGSECQSEAARERAYGEANVYGMCANDIDRLIRRAASASTTPVERSETQK